MLSKELFCKALSLIQEQEQADIDFSKALQLTGEGTFLYGVGNKYREAAILLLQDYIGDRYDYIGWWLYEGSPDYEVSDDDHVWHLKEPEDLYDFIVNNTGGNALLHQDSESKAIASYNERSDTF